MSTRSEPAISLADLVGYLKEPSSYAHDVEGEIEVHETHISVVLLVGEYAYKIKRPLKTEFLDYSTLQKRKYYCEEELRLGRRYAENLYLKVVPIGWSDHRIGVDVDGAAVEYAVMMRRFPNGALLSEQADAGTLSTPAIICLAKEVAEFHQSARVCDLGFADGWYDFLETNSASLFDQLALTVPPHLAMTLSDVRRWSDDFLANHRGLFLQRIQDGYIRECHGDMHLQNVVMLDGKPVLFDGIEFNDRLRWIDTLSDMTFLSMDLAFRGHLELARSFTNAYLERMSDYRSARLMRWFSTYRAIIRAMAASMKAEQVELGVAARTAAREEADNHVALAHQFTLATEPELWITHGVSGSGKTTASETVVRRHGAIRLRSDIVRKNAFCMGAGELASEQETAEIYSESSTRATYESLYRTAADILSGGYSVVIDATFLRRRDRRDFRRLADEKCVSFKILDCRADAQTLRRRIADRMERNDDASDADISVLTVQLATQEPLTDEELQFVRSAE